MNEIRNLTIEEAFSLVDLKPLNGFIKCIIHYE